MRMTLVVAGGLLVGCAQQPAAPPPAVAAPLPDYPVPRCDSKLLCDQMWIRAIQYAQMASGMKVMTVTEHYIATYPANQIGRMTGAVARYPVAEGIYEIRLGLSCYSHDNCAELAARGVNLFNMSVAGPQLSAPSP